MSATSGRPERFSVDRFDTGISSAIQKGGSYATSCSCCEHVVGADLVGTRRRSNQTEPSPRSRSSRVWCPRRAPARCQAIHDAAEGRPVSASRELLNDQGGGGRSDVS